MQVADEGPQPGLPNSDQEAVDRFGRPFGEKLHGSVPLVSHVSGDRESLGNFNRGIAKTDPLDPPGKSCEYRNSLGIDGSAHG